MSSSSSLAYSCGRCRQPLTLRVSPNATLASLGLSTNASSSNIGESQYDLLASQIGTISPNGARHTVSAGGHDYPASITSNTAIPILPRKVVATGSTTASTATQQQKLFDALSAASEVDHPLCSQCAEAWFSSMNKHVDSQKKERELLIQYEKDAKSRKEELGKRNEWLKEDTARLEGEEKTLVKDLLAKEEQKMALEEEMRLLEDEERQLEAEEAEFWLSHSKYTTEYNSHLQSSRSLLASYSSTLSILEKLQRTNVYSDAFCIGHDGGLATINGLRLGRLPNVAVDWGEINAAWGQALLLLKTIARKIGCEVQGYRLVPVGSFSRIEKLDMSAAGGAAEKGTVLELYGSGDWALGRLLQNRRFDSAMVAFLECLRQVIEYAEDRALEQNEELRIPHQIHKDKIGDVSIRLGSSDETWTRALRHVLLDLKILLADSCR